MFYVKLVIILLRVDQRGLRIGMPHKCLQFVEGHTIPQANRSECMTELVRICVNACTFSDLLHDVFKGMGL